MSLRYIERTRVIREHIIIEIAEGDTDDDAATAAERTEDKLWTVDHEKIGDLMVSAIDG